MRSAIRGAARIDLPISRRHFVAIVGRAAGARAPCSLLAGGGLDSIDSGSVGLRPYAKPEDVR